MCCKKCIIFLWLWKYCFFATGQCPLRDTLWQRIEYLQNKGIPDDVQLQELLYHRDKLSACPGGADSTDAYLFQRIGVMYFHKGDFQNSIVYTKNALDLLHNLEKKILVNPAQKFKCYRNLTFYFEALGLSGERTKYIDSGIAIGMASNMTDSNLVYQICDKMTNLFNSGDYRRCIQYASLSQDLAEKYGYTHSNIIKQIFSWKINALLLLKNYPVVAAELKNKIAEYSQSKDDDYIGNLYALWANYYIGIGKIDSALIYNRMAFRLNLNKKFNDGCEQSLGSIGFIYYQYLRDYDKALLNYFRAIQFAYRNQSISIFNNIGNVYLEKKQFDSAFYFYQRAFDQIHPGINEYGLPEILKKGPLVSMAEHVVTLVLDKADACLYKFRKLI